MIYRENKKIENIFRGSTPISKVYRGTKLVWIKGTPSENYNYFQYTTINGQIFEFRDMHTFAVYDTNGNMMPISSNIYDGNGKVSFLDYPHTLEMRAYSDTTLETVSFLSPMRFAYIEHFTQLRSVSYANSMNTIHLTDCPSLLEFYVGKNLKDVALVDCYLGRGLTFQTGYVINPEIGYCYFSTNSVREFRIPEGNRTLRLVVNNQPRGWQVFGSKIEKLYIPSTAELIDNTGGYLVDDVTSEPTINLMDIYCYAPIAPVIQDSAGRVGIAAYLPEGGTLHCPHGSDYSSWNKGEILNKHWNIVYDL